MQAEYKMETEKSYMILESGQTELLFSTQMLLENKIFGLIPFENRSFNGESKFFYDITGKHSLKEYVQKNLLQENEVRKLLQSLYCAVRELHSHFLEVGGLLMDAEYIYREEKGFHFCYYPPQEGALAEEVLKKLAEQLLELADYEEEDTTELIYRFYKSVTESEKGIIRILEEVLTQEPVVSESDLPKDEKEEVIETVPQKAIYWDTGTLICFLPVLIVSLCYLGINTFPNAPKVLTEVTFCVFALISLPGILMGFVDIERKK